MKNIFDYKERRRTKGVHYDELLKHIYTDNRNNHRICIEANTLRHTKDLFRFCLDLFCKGLVMCHGDENKRVEVDNLSMKQIQYVIDKLSYTGIMTIVQIFSKNENDCNEDLCTDSNDVNTPLIDIEKEREANAYSILKNSLELIDSLPDNDPMIHYSFKILVGEMVYCIRFEIQV